MEARTHPYHKALFETFLTISVSHSTVEREAAETDFTPRLDCSLGSAAGKQINCGNDVRKLTENFLAFWWGKVLNKFNNFTPIS